VGVNVGVGEDVGVADGGIGVGSWIFGSVGASVKVDMATRLSDATGSFG